MTELNLNIFICNFSNHHEFDVDQSSFLIGPMNTAELLYNTIWLYLIVRCSVMKLSLENSLYLVGLVTSWGSSNNHSSFSPISSSSGAIINPYLT